MIGALRCRRVGKTFISMVVLNVMLPDTAWTLS